MMMLRIIQRFAVRQFVLPDLGEKIKEATIVKWHVKEGDRISEFDPVADVSTDKMFTQIPSLYSGVIHKRHHQEQEMCQVGELLLEIDAEDGPEIKTKVVQKLQPVEEQKSQPVQSEKQSPRGLQRVSPSARFWANQTKIDLNSIIGTGIYGTITKQDVISRPQVKSTKQTQTISKVIQMTDFQKGMQKSMTQAQTIPHLYLSEDIDITNLSSTRELLKKQQNITFMTLFLKTFSTALLKFPIINSTYNPEKPYEYITHKEHNISLALDSPKGLVVPNIKNVQDLTLIELQKNLNELRKLGDEGKLGPKHLLGGTVCLSNIGTIAGTYLGPLILSPQVCIVGIGRVILIPQLIGGKYLPRKMINVTFGCDHRVLDGATVTRFSNEWRSLLEEPSLMLLNSR